MADKKTIAFDHHTADWVDDPYIHYQTMRDGCPVAYSEAHGGFWLLSRYQDVRAALRDWQTFSSNHPGRIAIPHTKPGAHPGIPIEFDPPDHTRYRDVVSQYFSPSAVNRHEPQVTIHANTLIDSFQPQGACDIVRDYATPLLANTLALFLNLPLEDVAQLERWADAVFAGRVDDPEGADRAMAALTHYIGEQLETRRHDPGSDLFSTLVKAEVDGRLLTDSELVGYGRVILLAGREATIDGLSNSLWYLAQNPTAQQQLRDDPKLMTFAVEEFLRTMSPIQLLGRVATRDVELHGPDHPRRRIGRHGLRQQQPRRTHLRTGRPLPTRPQAQPPPRLRQRPPLLPRRPPGPPRHARRHRRVPRAGPGVSALRHG